MPEVFSFFGSAGGDPREYNQLELDDAYMMFQTDGYRPNDGDELEIVESIPAAMTVDVKTGAFFQQGYFYRNTTDLELVIGASHATLDRIDTIVLRLDFLNTRDIHAVVLQGTPSGSPVAPTLTQDATTWEVALADVLIVALVTSILDADITDRRELGVGKHTHNRLPFCYAYRSTDQVSGNRAEFNAEDEDSHGMHDNSVNPERFTVQAGQNGDYAWSLSLSIDNITSTTTGSATITCYKNGIAYKHYTSIKLDSSVVPQGATISDAFTLVAGDYLEFSIFGFTLSASFKLQGNATRVSSFSIKRIR